MTAMLNWDSMRVDQFVSTNFSYGTVEKSFQDEVKELYKEAVFTKTFPQESSYAMYISIRRNDMSLDNFKSLARILTTENKFATALKNKMDQLKFQKPHASSHTRFSSCSPSTSTANFFMIALNTPSPQPPFTFDVWTGASGEFSTWFKTTLVAAHKNLKIENYKASSKQFKIYFSSPASSASADLTANASMDTE